MMSHGLANVKLFMYAQFILFRIYHKSDVSKDLLRQTFLKFVILYGFSVILNGAQSDVGLKRRAKLVTIINY
jgi:hypothetical protein